MMVAVVVALRAKLIPVDQLPPFGQVLDYVQTFATVFEGRSVAEQRLALTKLMVSAAPVKYKHNRYGIGPVLTELGHRLLQVAALVSGDVGTREAYKSSRFSHR